MLARLGVAMNNVDVVDNGQKAVVQEAKTAYDLVLMDMVSQAKWCYHHIGLSSVCV
jgi:hypothetical protein